jgi:PadR family transcriptional regulator, regulatory protein PadR
LGGYNEQLTGCDCTTLGSDLVTKKFTIWCRENRGLAGAVLSTRRVQNFHVDNQHDLVLITNMSTEDQSRVEVMQGTLDLLILRTLDCLGSLHGYGIARRIEQVSDSILALNQGTLYPALLRLEQQGLIDSEWGTSENNRRARFYSLTKKGQTRLAREIKQWGRLCQAVNGVIAQTP